MNSLFIAVFVAIIAAAVLLVARNLFSRGRKRKPASNPPENGQRSAAVAANWRAVRISPGLICCDAINRFGDRSLLAREAPRLPLAECDQKECRCKYIHLEDRRSGDDRRVELGDLGAFLPANQVERRSSTGRRVSDLAA